MIDPSGEKCLREQAIGTFLIKKEIIIEGKV